MVAEPPRPGRGCQLTPRPITRLTIIQSADELIIDLAHENAAKTGAWLI